MVGYLLAMLIKFHPAYHLRCIYSVSGVHYVFAGYHLHKWPHPAFRAPISCVEKDIAHDADSLECYLLELSEWVLSVIIDSCIAGNEPIE